MAQWGRLHTAHNILPDDLHIHAHPFNIFYTFEDTHKCDLNASMLVMCSFLSKCLPCTQVALLSELDGCIVSLIRDENGNHVIQKCVEHIDSALLDHLVHSHVVELCMHPFGCRVIQSILKHCNQSQVSLMLKEIHIQSKHLIKVPFFIFAWVALSSVKTYVLIGS